jgi:hypothetical protein
MLPALLLHVRSQEKRFPCRAVTISISIRLARVRSFFGSRDRKLEEPSGERGTRSRLLWRWLLAWLFPLAKDCFLSIFVVPSKAAFMEEQIVRYNLNINRFLKEGLVMDSAGEQYLPDKGR